LINSFSLVGMYYKISLLLMDYARVESQNVLIKIYANIAVYQNNEL